MALDPPAVRITGQMMKNHLGRCVGVLGEVTTVDSSGSSFSMKTDENTTITVYLGEPSQDYIGGFVEVLGKATSSTTLICSSMVVFPTEHSTSFDLSQYNKAVNLVHASKE